MHRVFARRLVDRFFGFNPAADELPAWLADTPLDKTDFVVGYLEYPEDPTSRIVLGDRFVYLKNDTWTKIAYGSITRADPPMDGVPAPRYRLEVDHAGGTDVFVSREAYGLAEVLMDPRARMEGAGSGG